MSRTNARWCIQSLDHSSGVVGDFVYVGSSHDRKAISPIFNDLGSLFDWMKSEGWVKESPNHSNMPFDCYKED